MIKLIASDLDGTLVKTASLNLDPEIPPIIRRLKAHGITFVAATGRQYENVRTLFASLGDEISYISDNGAYCIHDGKIFLRTSLDRELGLLLMQDIATYPGSHYVVNCEGMCYVPDDNPDFIEYMRHTIQNKMCVIKSPEDIRQPFFKIAMWHPEVMTKGKDHFAALLKERNIEDIRIVTSGSEWLDFMPREASKGNALRKLMKMLDIRLEECMAFGDQYNDVEMLQLAGISYSMTTAAPGMNYYSTYVTDSVKDVLIDLLSNLEL